MLTANNASVKDLTVQFAKFFNNKDAEGIGTLLTEDFSLFDPALKWVRGKEVVLSIFKKQFKEISKVSYEVVNVYEDGNTGILEFKITLDDLVLYGVDFMEWQNSKMTELRCYYNPPQNEILKPFSTLAQSLVEGSVYEHYKGKRYKILSIGRHSETLEESVTYQAVRGEKDVWVRPVSMFLENIIVDGQAQPRFKYVSG